MQDKELQALERRWRESQSREDEVALLQQRLRVGDLDPTRLRLAAAFGYQPALEVVDPPPLTDFSFFEGEDVDAYLGRLFVARRLEGVRVELADRVSIAAARSTFGSSLVTLSPVALEGIATLADRAYPHREDLLDGINETALRLAEASVLGKADANLLHQVLSALDGFYTMTDERMAAQGSLGTLTAEPAEKLEWLAQCLCACADEVAGNEDEDRPFPPKLAERIAAEVVPWLLGRADPVAHRVEAREVPLRARDPHALRYTPTPQEGPGERPPG